MRGLAKINSSLQLDAFIRLWCKVQSIQLTYAPDKIAWSLSANGEYSARLAYGVQFLLRIPIPIFEKVWTIKAKMRVKFFYLDLTKTDYGLRTDCRPKVGIIKTSVVPAINLWKRPPTCSLAALLQKKSGTALDLTFPVLHSRLTLHNRSRIWRSKCRVLHKKKNEIDECTAAAYIALGIWKE